MLKWFSVGKTAQSKAVPEMAVFRKFKGPNVKWFCRVFGVTSMFIFGFFNKVTAYTPGRIFTQNTSNDVVTGKEEPFGGPDDP